MANGFEILKAILSIKESLSNLLNLQKKMNMESICYQQDFNCISNEFCETICQKSILLNGWKKFLLAEKL